VEKTPALTPPLRARVAEALDHLGPSPGCSQLVAADGGRGPAIFRTLSADTPGLGVCATRLAAAGLRAEHGGSIVTLVLFDPEKAQLCGLCRQTLAELGPDARIFHARNASEAPLPIDARALLPEPFLTFHGEDAP